MPISLRRNDDGGAVGLDIDGRFLASASVRDGRLAAVASAELEPGVLADGEVADRAALTAALKDFAAASRLPRRVRLGVANQQIVVRVVDLPRIENEREREAALRYSAADAIAMPLDEAVLDHQVASYTTDADGVERMQVVVVAARRAMIEEYVAAVRDAGLRPDGIDLDAFALVRMLAGRDGDGDRDGAEAPPARVYCHLGGVSNLAIGVGTSCLFTRTLSARSGEEGAASRLADEIRMSIDYYMGQPGALAVADAVLSGEGARDADLTEALAAQLTIPVAAATPLGPLDPAPVPADDDPYRYTVAAGLALGAAA